MPAERRWRTFWAPIAPDAPEHPALWQRSRVVHPVGTLEYIKGKLWDANFLCVLDETYLQVYCARLFVAGEPVPIWTDGLRLMLHL